MDTNTTQTAFDASIPYRRNAPNPVEYGGPEIAKQQNKAYPDITTLVAQSSVDSTLNDTSDTVYQMGWRVVNVDQTTGKIEAIDKTFWFGFKDDIVVRIRPDSTGSLVDVRSVSREGKSDIGTNARRIRQYPSQLRSNLRG